MYACQSRRLITFISTLKLGAAPCGLLSAWTKVIPKAVDLVHTLMKDGDDTDVAFREMPPIDETALVSKEETFDAELGRDGL